MEKGSTSDEGDVIAWENLTARERDEVRALTLAWRLRHERLSDEQLDELLAELDTIETPMEHAARIARN
jgi:hypothetical protein